MPPDVLPFLDIPRGCIMAIDPGITGAVAFLDTHSWQLGVVDMPTITRIIAGKEKREPAPAVLSAWVRAVKPILLVAEQMQNFGFHPNPNDLMKLGRWRGQIEGIAYSHECAFEETPPSAWKAKMGVSADKAFSRTRAAKLFPACHALFARAKDHDRAEAAMLALYGCLVIDLRPAKPIGLIPMAPPEKRVRK